MKYGRKGFDQMGMRFKKRLIWNRQEKSMCLIKLSQVQINSPIRTYYFMCFNQFEFQLVICFICWRGERGGGGAMYWNIKQRVPLAVNFNSIFIQSSPGQIEHLARKLFIGLIQLLITVFMGREPSPHASLLLSNMAILCVHFVQLVSSKPIKRLSF